jgi:hypothetical protein
VPSFDHEFLVDLFRENAELAAELLRSCGGITIDHARIEHGSIDLSQVTSTEYRADAVEVLYSDQGDAVAGVIVEVQRQEDRAKLLSWPVYITALRAKLDCPAVLLVVTPDPAVASWARRPIDLGHPGFQLTPIVIGFADVPRVVDGDAASQLPQLAVLSAMAHPELDVATVAIDAISVLPEPLSQLYLDVILKALPDELRQTLEARVIKNYQYQSDFARKYYGQGISEGLEKGREEGRQEGHENGLRLAVETLVRAKLKVVSAEDLAKIAAITDLQLLTELITALGRARTPASARAALTRAVGR